MKKILYSIMALAISAFTLQSCEDVPAPYDIPGEGGNTEKPEVELVGDGTLENPYNAAAANAVAAALPVDGVTDHDVYIKGKIYSVKEEFGTQFGNASFYITDDGVSGEQFYVFRTLYLGNKKYTSGENIKEGDEVIICGKLTNYMGNTPETVQNGSYLYSLNGKTADGGGEVGEAKGDGSLENPYNSVAANNLAASLASDAESPNVYIKGKISSIKEEFSAQFGNATFYISDDGTSNGEFYVFRTLYFGNKKYSDGENIKVGDEVVIYGKVTNYMGNTPETVQNGSYLYSLNGKTGDNGGSDTPAEGEYINETFATSFGTFTVKTIKGQEWIIDFSTAKASGYVNKQNIESESYLVSPAIDLSNSKEACLSFEYILAYANNAGDNKVLITDNYNEASPGSSSWEDITGTFAEYKDWNTFHKYSKAIPAKYIGKKNVRIAFYYNASATGSKTWEVRNVILKEGKPDADDNTGGGGNTGGGDSGGVTDGNSVVLIPADLGLANATDVATLTLSDGTTITFDGGGNQNTPKYYNTGKAIRMYPQNSFTVSSSKKIASIVITCDVYNGTTYNASGDLKAEPGTTQTSDNIVTFSGINNKECKVTNVSTTTGAPSQVRMTKLTVVYAE